MNAIILAGGRSSRMGFDKAFMEIEGRPIIKKQLRLLKGLFEKIIIVSDNPYKGRLGAVKIIRDIIPNCGPLGGIYSGLSASSAFYNLVVACDMPFVNPKLIKYMRRRAYGYDVVVPKVNRRYEPLFSIYSKDCLKYIKPLLDKKILKLSRLFTRVKVREIKLKEILRFGSPEAIFMNINTPADLLKVSDG